MNIFGISIGTKNMGLALRPQIVELVEVSQGKLTQTAQAPVKGQEDVHMLQAIQAVIESAQLQTRRFAVSIPSQDILLRFFTLPLLPRSEWEAAIKFEARKHIPFRTDELIWDYHAVEDRARKQIAVVFAGVKKDRFEQVRGLLNKAGVEPTVIEPQNISLARVVAEAYPGSRQEFIGVVELNEEVHAAHIGIVKGQLPYLARDVSLGSTNVSFAPKVEPTVEPTAEPSAGQAVSASDENVWVAGQSVAAEPAVGQPMTESFLSGDESRERLLSELRLSLDFFTREYPSASISRLLIYGGGATVKSWCQGLAEELHCPVEMGILPLSGQDAAPETLPAASSIGIALQPLGGMGVKLDFLARSRREQGTVDVKAQMLTVVSGKGLEILKSIAKPLAVQVVAAIIGLVLFAQVSHRQVTRAQVELAETLQAQSAVGVGLQDRDEQALEELGQRLGKTFSMLQSLFEGQISVTEKLEALAAALPTGFWLEGFNYKNRLQQGLTAETSLHLKGACFLPERSGEELVIIGEFSDRIKQDPKFFRGFATARLGDIATAQDVGTHFAYRTFKLSCDSRGDR